jgi:hypothetical protein
VAVIDSRLVEAVRSQLAERRRLLDHGAHHVGWKLGMGERESIGGHIAVGYLTSDSVLKPNAFTAAQGAELHADAEAYIELAGPEEVGAYGLALELVDLAPLPGEPESVVVENVFHRAVCFGELGPVEPVGATISVRIGGTERAAGQWPDDVRDRVAALGEILDAAGEPLRRGDRIITGSIVQVPIAAGDRVAAVTGDEVSVTLSIV